MTENALIGQVVRKRARTNFTMIQNSMGQNDALSWNARGIMLYLLSLPEDWIIYKSEIIKHGDIGRDKFNKVWNELQDFGYLTKENIQNPENGKFQGVLWILNEEPEIYRSPENPLYGKKSVKSTAELKSRSTVKPSDGKSVERETRPLTNTHSLTNTHNKQIDDEDENKKESDNSFQKSLREIAEDRFKDVFELLDTLKFPNEGDAEAIKSEMSSELLKADEGQIVNYFRVAWEYAQENCTSDSYFVRYLVKNMQMQANKDKLNVSKIRHESLATEPLSDDYFASVDALRVAWSYEGR